MSEQGDRAVAISKLTELVEHQGLRAYAVGYLSAHIATEDLEKAVHSTLGFWEGLISNSPISAVLAEERTYDPRD